MERKRTNLQKCLEYCLSLETLKLEQVLAEREEEEVKRVDEKIKKYEG